MFPSFLKRKRHYVLDQGRSERLGTFHEHFRRNLAVWDQIMTRKAQKRSWNGLKNFAISRVRKREKLCWILGLSFDRKMSQNLLNFKDSLNLKKIPEIFFHLFNGVFLKRSRFNLNNNLILAITTTTKQEELFFF